ncbi:sulfatase-like hydrolase/transferase [Halobellus ruber]|uniref:Sulfatase-like hydrolase/transferase n=1 Tax=Halobellus ruber TaxID=2761102 RepID=A0A7J9SIR2_9EURY|nr:sulfatase-like hydrolase/transferase [Halobellus ruber]MBB6646618.1 sulfatase-like hydrolase/transferase [Halobellus ruber]
MPPSVQVLTLDCLRESTASDAVTPFLRSLPLQWSRCYSSGAWTLPAHASLFAGQDPIDHGVTRVERRMTGRQAALTTTARENGYATALFSENPQFSSATGFGECVDDSNDYIGTKLLRSEFVPVNHVDELSASAGLSLLRTILAQPHRLRNLVNTGYAAYRRFSDTEPTYPHHGRRVISHLESYLAEQTEPVLTVMNLLDPHNPYYGAPPGQESSRSPEEEAALRNLPSNLFYLFTDDPLPEDVRAVFGDWAGAFEAEAEIYREFSREADRLVERWRDDQPSVFEDSLVVVVGDHGQLFGTDGVAGHGLSLHPNGIHVPLIVDPPTEWDRSDRRVDAPVSIAGLGRALTDVVAGKIADTAAFVDAVNAYSRGPGGAVITCVDGPTIEVQLLAREEFDAELVDNHTVRKVACIYDEYVDVYECGWDDDTVAATSYEYAADHRTVRPDRETPPPPPEVAAWVRRSPKAEGDDVAWRTADEEQPAEVRARLENLGYR